MLTLKEHQKMTIDEIGQFIRSNDYALGRPQTKGLWERDRKEGAYYVSPYGESYIEGHDLCRVITDRTRRIKVAGKMVTLSHLKKIGWVNSIWRGAPAGDLLKDSDTGKVYFCWEHFGQQTSGGNTDTNEYLELMRVTDHPTGDQVARLTKGEVD